MLFCVFVDSLDAMAILAYQVLLEFRPPECCHSSMADFFKLLF